MLRDGHGNVGGLNYAQREKTKRGEGRRGKGRNGKGKMGQRRIFKVILRANRGHLP